MTTQALKFYKYALYSDIPDTVVKGGVYFAKDRETIYVATDTTKASLQKFGNSITTATFDGTKLTLTKYSGDTITVDLSSLKTAITSDYKAAITAAINALDSTVSNTAASAGSTASTQIKTSVTETDGKLSSISVIAPTFATKTELDTLSGKIDNLQSDVDSQLTLTAGANITITEDGNAGTITISGTPDTHYTSKNVVGDSTTANANKAVTTNGVYLNHLESNSTTPTSSHKITGSGSATVTSDSNGNITIYADTNTDTHYIGANYVGGATGGTNSAVSDPYIKYLENGTVRSAVQLKGGGATTVKSDTSKVITISSTDTNTTYTIDYGTTKSGYVTLKGSDGSTSQFDASAFIKDGMLIDAALYTATATATAYTADIIYLGTKYTVNYGSVTSGHKYILLAWNVISSATTYKGLALDVNSLVDVYTGTTPIAVSSDNKISLNYGNGLTVTSNKLAVDSNAGEYINVTDPNDTTATTDLNTAISDIIESVDDINALVSGFDVGVTTVGTTGSGTSVSFSGNVKLYNPAVKDIRDYRYLNVVGVNSTDGTTTNPNALAVKLPTGLTVRSLKGADGTTLQDEITLDTDTSTSTLGRVVFCMTKDDGENAGNKITATTQGLGTAAGKNIGDFATAAQGTKADSAVQTITGSGITASKSGTTYALGLEWSNFE